jgi:AraC family transcriptional regulator
VGKSEIVCIDAATGRRKYNNTDVRLSANWPGARLERWTDDVTGQYVEHILTKHVVAVNLGEAIIFDLKWSGHAREVTRFDHLNCNISPAGIPYKGTASGERDALILLIDPEFVAMASNQMSKTQRSLLPKCSTTDALVTQIVLALQHDAEHQQPWGPLYGERLTTALAAHLAINYSDVTVNVLDRPTLSTTQQTVTEEFIRTNLDRPISLSELAGLNQMDRYSFLRAFKKVFGIPPHRFVVQARLETAKILLRSRRLTISEIALHCGFSSNTHFATVFRRFVGTSPRAFRKGVS